MDYTKQALGVDSNGSPLPRGDFHNVLLPQPSGEKSQTNSAPQVWLPGQDAKMVAAATAVQVPACLPDTNTSGFVHPGVPLQTVPAAMSVPGQQQAFQNYLPYSPHVPPTMQDAQTAFARQMDSYGRGTLFDNVSSLSSQEYKHASPDFLIQPPAVLRPASTPSTPTTTMDLQSVDTVHHHPMTEHQTHSVWSSLQNYPVYNALSTEFSARVFDPNQMGPPVVPQIPVTKVSEGLDSSLQFSFNAKIPENPNSSEQFIENSKASENIDLSQKQFSGNEHRALDSFEGCKDKRLDHAAVSVASVPSNCPHPAKDIPTISEQEASEIPQSLTNSVGETSEQPAREIPQSLTNSVGETSEQPASEIPQPLTISVGENDRSTNESGEIEPFVAHHPNTPENKHGENDENSAAAIDKERPSKDGNCADGLAGSSVVAEQAGDKETSLTDSENNTSRQSLEDNETVILTLTTKNGQSQRVPLVSKVGKRHGRKGGKQKTVACKRCQATFTSAYFLSKHMSSTHMSSPCLTFSCVTCNKQFGSKSLLKQHMSTHVCVPAMRDNSKVYLAPGRRTRLSTKIEKLVRVPQKKRGRKPGTTMKLYQCQLCTFVTKAKMKLNKHMKMHKQKTSSNMFKCPLCTFKSKSTDSSKVHAAMHASTKTTSCLVCNTTIVKRPALIEHLVSHSSDTSFVCKKCGDNFELLQHFLMHLVEHEYESLSPVHPSKAVRSSAFDLATPKVSSEVPQSELSAGPAVLMDSTTMEDKLSEMSTVASRLFELTRVVSLLDEKAKVMCQLSDISALATELAMVSGNVLNSYQATCGRLAEDGRKGQGAGLDETSLLTMIDMASVKQELGEGLFTTGIDANGMQIKLSFEKDSALYMDSALGDADEDDDIDNMPVLRRRRAQQSRRKKKRVNAKILDSLRCGSCDMEFSDVTSLRRHLSTHDDIRPYSCDKCGQTFRRNDHLKKHQVTHSDVRPFICAQCPYAAKTEHRLKIHMISHSETKNFMCPNCPYSARTKYELNHHLKRHERRDCSQCSFFCYSRIELKRHMFIHTTFNCPECSFSTKDKKEYSKHAAKHRNTQHFCCELCGYSCDTLKKFKYHKLRHENKTPFQCPDCDYKCSSRASFDCHRLKHAGLKPYLCSFCGSSFRKSSHLNQHLLIHKDEKAFKCEQCGYSCRTKHNLKEHEMTHSGEKPFSCKYCSFSCRRNKALQIHMAKHENSMLMIAL